MNVLAVLTSDGPRLVDAAAPLLRADDLGVLRGESVFETARIAGGKPAYLDSHLRRLARSAERLAIPLPDGWHELAAIATAVFNQPDGVLRLVCSKGAPDAGPTGFALATPIPPETVRGREQGVTVITVTLGVTADVRRRAPWLLGGVKSTSYAVNMATLRHAHDEGADDAIWLSSDGQVLEAPTATVAWVTGGRLVTPPATEAGILAGTTLDVALGLLDVPYEIRPGTAGELAAADEVLLLSSVRGVAPVIALDGRELGVGPVTARLRDAFERALLG